MISSPYLKKKSSCQSFGNFPSRLRRLTTAQPFKIILSAIRKLVEIIVFSPYFRIRIRLLSQFLEIKPSTYQYRSAAYIAVLPPPTYQPCRLQGVLLPYGMGYLILRRVSRLDAFSVYLIRTSLPCRAAGATTGAQQVRSSRSSRTKDKSSQVSCAHDGQGPNCLTTF